MKCCIRLLEVGLIGILLLALTPASLAPVGTSSGITAIKYYLTTQRGVYPHYQFLLTSEEPASDSSEVIPHLNSILWRTNFESNGLNFSSGQWTFDLWFGTDTPSSCSLSLGYYDPYMPYPYTNITNQKVFDLDQSGLKEYSFTFIEVPTFNIPGNGSFAFRLDAPVADLYVYAETPSNVYFSSEPASGTSTTTATETTSITSQSETSTSEATTVTQSTSETVHTTTSIQTGTETAPQSATGTDHSTLIVHAHPKEAQYPEEPSDELKVQISVEYLLDGVRKAETMETLFSIEADKGSTVNLTVSSFPSDLTWIEWDNYGAGRTSGMAISIQMDSNRHAIAYFLGNTTGILTSASTGETIYVVPGYSVVSIIIGLLSAGAVIHFMKIRRRTALQCSE